MAEKMTLEELSAEIREWEAQTCRDRHKYAECRDSPSEGTFADWADAIDAHLSQPAQAVDVGAIREVVGRLLEIVSLADNEPGEFYSFDLDEQANKLTRAIGNASATK